MDLASRIIVRYQSDGHVRFQLPAALNAPGAASHLAAELRRIEGVYRVDTMPKQCKLSIRYIPHIRSLPEIAAELHRLIQSVEYTSLAAEPRSGSFPSALGRQLADFHPIQWFRSKTREARETVAAMKILARHQSVQRQATSLLDNDTVIRYLNEVLVIFLIKLHWPEIRHQWIKQPWVHRYEWMAATYLVYLLVRSRRPSP